jgi:hypothetical protein
LIHNIPVLRRRVINIIVNPKIKVIIGEIKRAMTYSFLKSSRKFLIELEESME